MAGPYKLDQRGRHRKAVTMLAKGQSMTKVAREVGVGVSSVSRWSKRDDVRSRIEEQARRYTAVLPAAVSLSRNLLNAARAESTKLSKKSRGEGETIDFRLLAIGQHEAECLRKSAGLQPSGQTFATNNLFFGDSEQLSPVIRDLVSRILLDSAPQECIDVTPDESTTDEP